MLDFRGKRVLIVGLARSGRAAARFLRLRGALVTLTDSRPAAEFGADFAELLAEKMGLELGAHREETFLGQDLIVVSPGVPWGLPELQAARRRGIPVVAEVEVASWFLEEPLVGITGTNGKTTTTALLGKILETSGFSTFVGGNIGVPLISAVDQVSPGSILVTELSSFQLEAIQQFRPHVAVLLNLSPNHLDRHASFAEYVAAKAQIFRNQKEDDYAILNADDPTVLRLAPAITSRKVFFSRWQDLPDGVLVSNGNVVYRVRNLDRALLETRDVSLRGAFNLENVLAAVAAACVLGADFDAIRRAVAEFQAVEHRLEYVRTICGVQFYNDSKATSVDATAKALSAFDRPVCLILGGKDKGAPYGPLRPLIESRVRCVFLIGAAADRIAEDLAGSAGLVRSGDLETAVRQAFKAAESGDVVLLSPACASYDQFQDFEHRGRVFKEIVERLAHEIGQQRIESRNWRLETGKPKPETKNSKLEARNSASGPEPSKQRVPNFQFRVSDSNPEARIPSPVPLEPVSLYEVGGEELLRQETEGRSAEPGVNLQLLSPQDLRPLETVEDEPLPFEFVAKPSATDMGQDQVALGVGEQSKGAQLRGAWGRKTKKRKSQ